MGSCLREKFGQGYFVFGTDFCFFIQAHPR